MLKATRNKLFQFRQPALRLVFPLLLAALPLSSGAAKQTTADQLKQILTAAQAGHRNDQAVLQQLTDLTMTARLSTPVLQQLIAISPGPKTTQALRALADDSAFLPPPPNEILTIAPPAVAQQKAIMAEVIHYVARTLPTLPNFFAARVTEHYVEAGRYDNRQGDLPGGLYSAGVVKSTVAYRDGRETDDPSYIRADPAAKKLKPAKSAAATNGLSSWGEFGPILGVVLVDAAKGKLSWSHWEQQGDKRIAVFQFSVDRAVSHYNVQYCCVAPHEDNENAAIGTPGQSEILRQITGYQGHLEVDPDSGAVLGITIEADLHPDDHIQRAAMMVEYGPVKIGDKTYFCPTHSVSISVSREEEKATPISPIISVNRLLLNDVQFTGYRRFGSEIAMVEEPAAKSDSGSGSTEEATSLPQPASGTSSNQAEMAASSQPASPPPSAAPVLPPTSAVSEEDQEFLIREVDSLPGFDAPSTSSANTGSNESGTFTLQATTRLVDVSLFALDKHDKPVTDLRPEEIEVYDNGRKQRVRNFHHPNLPSTPQPAAQPETPTDTFTNAASSAASTEEASDLLILLMDEAHLPFNDLNRARGEVLRYLHATRPTSRAALYSISEHGFRVIQDVTTDHALLESKLAAWQPNASAVSQAQTLDRRNRQQFDTVHSEQDMNSVNGNSADSPEAITSIDPELRQMGDNPLRQALGSIVGLARHFATVPGHKSLAWISGDSVLADLEDSQVRTEKGDKQNEAALLHAREVLNEAHIALYAVDASPVTPNGGGAVSAELGNASVQLDPTATANSRPGGAGGPQGAAIGAARTMADMQQNLHAIQGPIRQLAEGTGGLAINKGGDLKATLDGIDQTTTALYEVGFDPDTPADNKFHTLVLKIPDRKGLKLRYRTGYLYNEESATTKSRFQQAIWSPQDLTGIQISADTIPGANTPSGKSAVRLRVTMAGLGLEHKGDNPASERWTDRLYIYVAQRNDATQKAEVSGETLRLSLKQATYDTGLPAGIPYQRTVEPAFKEGSIRVIVVDANSGKIGSVTLPATALHP